MFKKIICLLVVLTMALIPSMAFAQSDTVSFSRDTVITQDNLNSILTHYGINPSTDLTPTTTVDNGQVTVGQLEDAINAFKQMKNHLNNNANVSSASTSSVRANLTDDYGFYGWVSTPSYYWKTLSSTSYPSGNNWGIHQSVSAEWLSGVCYTNPEHTQTASVKNWHDYASPSVELVTQYNPYVGVTNYKLESSDVDAYFITTTFGLTSDVTIGYYFCLGLGNISFDIKLGEFGVHTYSEWGASSMS